MYVLDRARWGTYSVKTTDPQAHPSSPAERQRDDAAQAADGADEIPQQMSDALLLGEEAT